MVEPVLTLQFYFHPRYWNGFKDLKGYQNKVLEVKTEKIKYQQCKPKPFPLLVKCVKFYSARRLSDNILCGYR